MKIRPDIREAVAVLGGILALAGIGVMVFGSMLMVLIPEMVIAPFVGVVIAFIGMILIVITETGYGITLGD